MLTVNALSLAGLLSATVAISPLRVTSIVARGISDQTSIVRSSG